MISTPNETPASTKGSKTSSGTALQFSATQWIFGSEELEATASRLASLGYDGIELAGDPDTYDAKTVRAVLDRHGLSLTSICGMYPHDRDLSSPDPGVRANGVRYIRRCAQLASELGADIVIVVPGPVGRVTPITTEAEEWELAVLSIGEAADEAAECGVRLAIEALNRYESYFLRSLQNAARLALDIDRRNVGLMADLFHMNIEEADVAGAIRAAGNIVWHVHLADSNRRPPGLGHTDFAGVMAALTEIGYEGALTMEFMPPTSNPYETASLDVPAEQKQADAKMAIDYVRDLI
jgi:D-psicose/D-tagatose/L-ribulose 3-epimerase